MGSRHTVNSLQPLVSVLTPVYNGEAHLAECIESVLGQTYGNWEYVIVNNCSTDRTLEIATSYSRGASRIRVVNNAEFVNAIRNHNICLSLMSTGSKYCKFVQADDLLFSTCLEEMVNVAEAHPSVGIVGSYQLWNRRVRCDGLPYPSAVVSGREICRTFFLQREAMFGTMSGFLLRSDLVRKQMPFLNEKHLFADTEVYFEVLQDHDYGFVHQVLSLWRTNDEALSSIATRYNQWSAAVLYLTMKYGPIYLTPQEYDQCRKQTVDRYYRRLGRELLRLREKSFWEYHRWAVKDCGLTFSLPRLLAGTMLTATDVFLEPFRVVGREIKRHRASQSRLRQKKQAVSNSGDYAAAANYATPGTSSLPRRETGFTKEA
jgi:glycosyltransferase involved in cell wall biosynthesis